MEEAVFPIATLVMPDHEGLDPAPYLADACNVLADHEGLPVRMINDRVIGEEFIVTVKADVDGDYGPSVSFAVLSHDGLPAEGDDALWILASLVKTSMRHSPFDLMSWVDGDDLLDRETFDQFALASGVTAWTPDKQLQGFREELKMPEQEEERTGGATFLNRGAKRSAAESRMGAAGWLMTGALAAVSAPVAAALAGVALVRGMEFRLATQIVSVTVLFVTLSNTDLLTRVVRSVLF